MPSQDLKWNDAEATSATVVCLETRSRGYLNKLREVQPDPTHEGLLRDLLEKTAQRDQRAFEQFYDATISRVYGLALRIVKAPEIAEEVVSDVYLQVWNQASRFDSQRGSPLAWLMVMCRSRALDTLRRGKPESQSLVEEQLPAADAHTEDLLLTIEQSSELHAALKILEPKQRHLLSLAYFRGYSHRELAEFTAIPLGTVKTLIRRALLALRQELSQAAAGAN